MAIRKEIYSMSHRWLLDRIYAGKYKASREARDCINLFIPGAVAVDAENVSVWQVETKTEWQQMIHKMPHRLPFPVMWFEWSSVAVHEDKTETPGKNGCMIAEIRDFQKAIDEGHPRDYEVPISGMLALFFLHDQSASLTCLTGNATFNEQFTDIHYGKQYQTPGVFSDEEGVAASYSQFGMDVVVSSLCFFACKNIEVRRLQASKKKARKNDRLGIPTPEFHVIEVHKQRVRNVYEGGISRSPAVTHARMIRGHDKTYTEDGKLFGKHVGRWFWESHAVGDIGTPTVNDYKVYEPRHKGDCIN